VAARPLAGAGGGSPGEWRARGARCRAAIRHAWLRGGAALQLGRGLPSATAASHDLPVRAMAIA
jgi:hypothetical protein